jgi:hypothetical protein
MHIRVSRRNSLARAMAMASLCAAMGSCHPSAKSPTPKGTTTVATTWVIKVQVTPQRPKPTSYTFTAQPPAAANGCKYATASSGSYPPGGLKVCLGDTIQWKGDSPGNNNDLAITMPDQILNDDQGNATSSFAASNGATTTGGGMNSSAKKKSHHEWFVTLFDHQTGEHHSDDPKIIIGQ